MVNFCDGTIGALGRRTPSDIPLAGSSNPKVRNAMQADYEALMMLIPEVGMGGAALPKFTNGAFGWGLVLPLWIPTALIATLTAWSWWPARRGPGRCRKCRYDLRGLSPDATGQTICPECGRAAPAPQ